jgi:hypothetical protein
LSFLSQASFVFLAKKDGKEEFSAAAPTGLQKEWVKEVL